MVTSRKEAVPRAPEGPLNSKQSCGLKINLSRLDFLQRSRADIDQLGQFFLCQTSHSPLLTDIFAKNREQCLITFTTRSRHDP